MLPRQIIRRPSAYIWPTMRRQFAEARDNGPLGKNKINTTLALYEYYSNRLRSSSAQGWVGWSYTVFVSGGEGRTGSLRGTIKLKSFISGLLSPKNR